jgi:hypothetical protein
MDYELTDDYIAEARQRAYRFQSQWTGTSGALAADVARLLIERKRMQGTITDIQETNAQLRAAVEARLAGDCCGGGKCQPEPEPAATIPVDWILQGQKEMDAADDDIRWRGDSILAEPDNIRPGSREFLAVLDEIKKLHLAKTLDYGMDEDALSNIRSSADVVNMPAWSGCILRISDKMHRLRAFFRRGRVEFDGIEDTLLDIACYSVIALVLYRECCQTRSESESARPTLRAWNTASQQPSPGSTQESDPLSPMPG